MLTYQEYLNKYPNDRYLGWAKMCNSTTWPKAKLISSGFLEFTPETACCWGGPFTGNHCLFRIQDFTYADRRGVNLIDYLEQLEIKMRRSAEFYQKDFIPFNDQPSREKPIAFQMYGNDDTSYTKFYSSSENALDELQLLIVCEPLDFHEVIELGFIFTN